MIVELDGREVSLTDEQVSSFGKLTKLQRGVALAKLSNGDITEAHRNAGGKSNNETHRYRLASEILKNPDTASFVNSFKSLDASNIAAMVLSRDELLLDLTDIARTTLDDVVSFSERPLIDMENGMTVLSSTIHIRSIDEISPGARKAIKSVKQTKYGLEVTMYDGLTARKQISEMCGYDAPIKTELSGKIQTQEIPDEEIEQKLKTLGLGRYHNQLGEKIVTK
jgi:phage terminase small subunit